MTRNGSNLILEGLAESRVYEAMSQEDIQKIDVKSVKPEKKDLDRAEGLKLNGKKSHEDGSPWAVSAGKMAKLIKDPMKLVRRSKAVRQTYGDTYSKDKEADVWTPFREALVNMGFTEEQISEIEGVEVDKSVQKKEVKKIISTDDKPAGWTPFDENKSEVDEMNNRMSNIIDGLRGGQVTQFGNVNESRVEVNEGNFNKFDSLKYLSDGKYSMFSKSKKNIEKTKEFNEVFYREDIDGIVYGFCIDILEKDGYDVINSGKLNSPNTSNSHFVDMKKRDGNRVIVERHNMGLGGSTIRVYGVKNDKGENIDKGDKEYKHIASIIENKKLLKITTKGKPSKGWYKEINVSIGENGEKEYCNYFKKTYRNELDTILDEGNILQKKNKGSVNEDKWITIKGRHTLVDNDGNIKDDKFKKQIDTNKSKSSVKKSMKDTIKSLGMDPENAGANYSDIEDLDYSRYVSDHIMDIKKEFGVEDADKEFEELADLQYDLKDSLHLRINSKWNNKPGAKERFDGEMSEYKKRIKDIKNNLMSKGLNEKDCDELLDYSGLNIVKIDRFIKKFIKFN